jgi:hypothetical protein
MRAARGWANNWFMFEDERLTRISIGKGSRTRTLRGIGIGSSEAEVHRAYGPGLRVEPHRYTEWPARYLTVWARSPAHGLRFETDPSRRVRSIHAGPSIEYVEGCL